MRQPGRLLLDGRMVDRGRLVQGEGFSEGTWYGDEDYYEAEETSWRGDPAAELGYAQVKIFHRRRLQHLQCTMRQRPRKRSRAMRIRLSRVWQQVASRSRLSCARQRKRAGQQGQGIETSTRASFHGKAKETDGDRGAPRRAHGVRQMDHARGCPATLQAWTRSATKNGDSVNYVMLVFAFNWATLPRKILRTSSAGSSPKPFYPIL